MSDPRPQRRSASFSKHQAPRSEISTGKIALLGGVMLVCIVGAVFFLLRG
jgi:hypothetical protein